MSTDTKNFIASTVASLSIVLVAVADKIVPASNPIGLGKNLGLVLFETNSVLSGTVDPIDTPRSFTNSMIGSHVPESALVMIYISVNTQFSVIGIKTSVLPESCGEVLIVTCACVGVVALADTVAVQMSVKPVFLTMIHHFLVCVCRYMAFLVCIGF